MIFSLHLWNSEIPVLHGKEWKNERITKIDGIKYGEIQKIRGFCTKSGFPIILKRRDYSDDFQIRNDVVNGKWGRYGRYIKLEKIKEVMIKSKWCEVLEIIQMIDSTGYTQFLVKVNGEKFRKGKIKNIMKEL